MTNRFTVFRQHHVEFAFWLIFNGVTGDVRMVRGEPSGLGRDERAMACQATLPNSLFTTPQLRASITIPGDQAPSEFRLDIEAAREAFKGALGVDIDLRVTTPETEPS